MSIYSIVDSFFVSLRKFPEIHYLSLLMTIRLVVSTQSFSTTYFLWSVFFKVRYVQVNIFFRLINITVFRLVTSVPGRRLSLYVTFHYISSKPPLTLQDSELTQTPKCPNTLRVLSGLTCETLLRQNNVHLIRTYFNVFHFVSFLLPR